MSALAVNFHRQMIGTVAYSAADRTFVAHDYGRKVIGIFASAQDARTAVIVEHHRRAAAYPVKRVRRKLSPNAGRSLMRCAETIRLCQWRLHYGVPIDQVGFAKVAADALSFTPQGCDHETMTRLAGQCGIAVDEAVAMAAIHRVDALRAAKGKAYRLLCGLAAARLLGVTAEERWQCSIRTMKAVDETPAEAAARRKQERREYERERSRCRRRDGGATARSDSVTRRRPWEAAGVSRATWYRRRKATEAAQAAEKPAQTDRETVSTAHTTRAPLGIRAVAFVSRQHRGRALMPRGQPPGQPKEAPSGNPLLPLRSTPSVLRSVEFSAFPP